MKFKIKGVLIYFTAFLTQSRHNIHKFGKGRLIIQTDIIHSTIDT